MVHTHKHPWLCIALYTTVNVVITYGDFLYISVQARTYLNRIKQDGLDPYSTMTLRSVTRNHMLISSALRFSQADCPFRFFLKFIFYSDYHWEQVLPVFSFPTFVEKMVVKALGVSRTTSTCVA